MSCESAEAFDFGSFLYCALTLCPTFLRIAEAFAEDKIAFDAIVSFSGLEHDGLGRYGDPVNPYGDFSAMREIWLCLKPGVSSG